MRTLKQSTTYSLSIFMTDSTDHLAGKTGLTLTITASKAGAAFGSITPTVTELASGWYSLALTTAHTDTLGDLALHITGAGADPTDVAMQVRANALGDTLPANVTQISGDATAADNLEWLLDETPGASPWVGVIDSGVAQSVTGTTLVLRAAAAFGDDVLNGATIVITNGTQVGSRAVITDFVASTNTATILGWPGATPAGTPSYRIFGSASFAASIADAVWDEALAGHAAPGSAGAALTGASSAGDPWTTALPGAYGAGTAGKILGDNINAPIDSRASQTSVDDLPTNAELATALGTADDAILAAIAALNNLSQANIRTALGLASANLDTQLDALPTAAELATALGTADDAILAAIAALNNLSAIGVRTAVGLASANLDTQLAALPTAAAVRAEINSNGNHVKVGTSYTYTNDTTLADEPVTITATP